MDYSTPFIRGHRTGSQKPTEKNEQSSLGGGVGGGGVGSLTGFLPNSLVRLWMVLCIHTGLRELKPELRTFRSFRGGGGG